MRRTRPLRFVAFGALVSLGLLGVAGCSGDGPRVGKGLREDPSSPHTARLRQLPPQSPGSEASTSTSTLPSASSGLVQQGVVQAQLTELLHAIGAQNWPLACKHIADAAIAELKTQRGIAGTDCPTVAAAWLTRGLNGAFPSYVGVTVDASQIVIRGTTADVRSAALTYSPPLLDPANQQLNANRVELVLNQTGEWQVLTLVG